MRSELLLLLMLLHRGALGQSCVGHAFVDVNGDGVQESFELNAQGIVYLNVNTTLTEVSDAQGNVNLPLSPGELWIAVVPDGGQQSTPALPGPYLAPSGGPPCVLPQVGMLNIPSVTLTQGQVITISVFGSLFGIVWLTGVGFITYYAITRGTKRVSWKK
jgi:hypothetical protein